MMSFDCLGVMSFSKITVNNGVAIGGGLTHLQTIETRRRETPKLQFIIVENHRIRAMVYDLVIKNKYPTFAKALHATFTEYSLSFGPPRLWKRSSKENR